MNFYKKQYFVIPYKYLIYITWYKYLIDKILYSNSIYNSN